MDVERTSPCGPGTTPKALPQLDQWLRGTRLGGTLLARRLTEIGVLNQILLIREHGSEAAIAADRDAIVRSGNPRHDHRRPHPVRI